MLGIPGMLATREAEAVEVAVVVLPLTFAATPMDMHLLRVAALAPDLEVQAAPEMLALLALQHPQSLVIFRAAVLETVALAAMLELPEIREAVAIGAMQHAVLAADILVPAAEAVTLLAQVEVPVVTPFLALMADPVDRERVLLTELGPAEEVAELLEATKAELPAVQEGAQVLPVQEVAVEAAESQKEFIATHHQAAAVAAVVEAVLETPEVLEIPEAQPTTLPTIA